MSTPIPSLGNKTPEQLRVAELREELKKRGINIKGLKKDLVERLDEILRQEAAEAEAEADESKKSSPEQVSDEEEIFPVAAADVVEVVTKSAEEFAAVEVVEPERSEALREDDAEPGIVEPVTDEDGFSTKGMESETDTSYVTLTEPEPALKDEAVVIEAHGTAAAELVPKSKFSPVPTLDEHPVAEPESIEVVDEGKAFDGEEGEEGEAKVESEDLRDDILDSSKLLEADDKITSDGAVEGEVTKSPDVVVEDQAEHLKPVHRPYPASSTDAVIIEASEASENIPAENAALSEGLRSTAYGKRDVEEEESVVEDTGREQATEMMTTDIKRVETVSVVTETTVVTTETFVVNEIEAEGEGSFTHRSSDAGTLSMEDKVDEEAEDEQIREKEEDGMEVEQVAKGKDSKPMEIDSENLTGTKRKDGEELKQQEPTKRQRRWNSDKSIEVSAEVSAPKVITTDPFKETVAPEGRAGTQAPVVGPSPSTTAASTPKASAPSTSFDKPAPSRPVLARADIAVNGEVEKKGVVPPPSRSPTVSLKIDRFVRPFTIKAVRELLEQTGTVEEMWMDQIKTHCFVTYSSVDEATATRNALYHLQWPVAGGKLLIAEFVDPEEVKSRVDGSNDKPTATPVTTPRGSANSSTVAGAMGSTPPAAHVPTSALPPPPPLPPPPRERPALPLKKEPEPPIPTLDDLFKKTRTKPQVYFLPLTEEQVADKLRNKQPVSKAPVKA